MKKFSTANEEELFLKKETTEGTLVYPAATDKVLAVGVAATTQEAEFVEDEQIRARRSRLSPIKLRYNPGTWSFTTYVKPSGTPGTAPETDVLFECAFGKKTVDPGVSVVYEFDSSNNLPSFSFWRKVGHTVFAMAGCTVNVAEFTVTGSELAQIAWSGEFMKWAITGESKAASTVSATDTEVQVDDATRYFNTGGRILLGSDDNGGNGYTITNINYSTNTITFTPAAVSGCSIGDTIAAWYPTSGTELGTPASGKLGIVTIDGTNAIILSSTITLTNNIKYYTDEKNGQLYPAVYGAPGFRDVTGTITLYFYKNTTGYFYRSDYAGVSPGIQDALLVPAGAVTGKRMKLSCPQIEYKTPTISGDEEVMMELPFTAVGTSTGDDEFSVTFD